MSTMDDNLKRRMAETMGSESDPELVTPMTAGSEELSEYNETFPLVRQFRQTNMRSGRGRHPRVGPSGRGKDQDS